MFLCHNYHLCISMEAAMELLQIVGVFLLSLVAAGLLLFILGFLAFFVTLPFIFGWAYAMHITK